MNLPYVRKAMHEDLNKHKYLLISFIHTEVLNDCTFNIISLKDFGEVNSILIYGIWFS